MTINEIITSDKVYLTPTDIATVLRCDPQCIREQAKRDPERIGFPVIIIGHRVRIPRIPFLQYLGYL